MITKQFTNKQVIDILNTLGGESGFTRRKLPVKILYAINRSAPNIEAAYKAYSDTLQALCEQYGVTPQTLNKVDADSQEELNKEIVDLLSTVVSVDIHPIDEAVIKNYDDTKCDAMSYVELSTLFMFINTTESEEK